MQSRPLIVAPPEVVSPKALRELRATARNRRWVDPVLRGVRHFGWGGQRALSARYAATQHAIVDGRLALDAEAFAELLRPQHALPDDSPPFPEARVADVLARSADAARTPARVVDYWWKLGHPVEHLKLFRAVGDGGEALADVSAPLLAAVARALGRWDRLTVTGPSGTLVLWVGGEPAAAISTLDFGLPEIRYPVFAPSDDPPEAHAPKALFSRDASDAERASWVGRAADEIARHFGGRRFDRTLFRPAHWAVAGRAGVLRFELDPPLAGGAWQFVGAEEPWGATVAAPPYIFMPAWQVLGPWGDLPAALGRRLSALAAPPGERPPPWSLVPPPAPQERYQIDAEGGRWRITDRGAPLRGSWASLPQAKALAFRLNASTGLAAASRFAQTRLLP